MPANGNHFDESLQMTPELRSKISTYVNWEALENSHFLRQVELNRKGGAVGWDNGFDRLNKALYGTHRGRYYLVGADSGVGKTTFSDFAYLISQYEYAKLTGKRWFCYYYSFELSKTEKIARWVSSYIHLKFGKVIPSTYIMGRIRNNMVTDEDMEYIRAGFAYVDEMLQHIVIIEDPVHPTKIFMDLRNHHYAKYGKIDEEPIPKGSKKQYGTIRGYTPNPGYEDAMVSVMIDHVALLAHEQGYDTKQTIDLFSKYAVALRNIFSTTFVVLQQFNTEMQSWSRSGKVSDKFIAPQRLDFGDSKYTYRDADVVLGLVAPHLFDLGTYFDYDVARLGNYMLGTHVMKHRYGPSAVFVAMFVHVLSGLILELPPQKEINDLTMAPFYELAEQTDELCRKFSPRTA
jgi:hypothetical protein